MSRLLFAFVTIFIFCKTNEVSSEQLKCSTKYDSFIDVEDNTKIDCKTQPCIAKCCPPGEVLVGRTGCNKFKLDKKNNYTDFKIYKNDIKNKIEVSGNTTIKNFKLVYNDIFRNKSCSKYMKFTQGDSSYYVLEDGSLELKLRDTFSKRNKLEFCMEYFITKNKNKSDVIYNVYYTLDATEPRYYEVDLIITIGTLVSSVFLFLTFLVYCLLPYLRNINGIIQMAYVAGIMTTYILHFIREAVSMNNYACKYYASLLYFSIVSSFLWLAVMSFNLWWTLRGTRYHRTVHRRGELVKFGIYAVCVYGTTAALTIICSVVDSLDYLPTSSRPRFEVCLTNKTSANYYLEIPIAVLISINCLLFVMTLYNIWQIKRGINSFSPSETKKNQDNVSNFKVYVKISVMMGVNWIIEASQMGATRLAPIPFLLVNLYNSFIGLVIFILLIADKKKIRMLCKRFNINISSKWTPNMQTSTINSSENSGSQKKASVKSLQTVELTNVENPPQSTVHI